jgi:hypothetical protein
MATSLLLVIPKTQILSPILHPDVMAKHHLFYRSHKQEDVTQKLKKYADHQKGILCDEEFKKLKMELDTRPRSN